MACVLGMLDVRNYKYKMLTLILWYEIFGGLVCL